MKKKYQAQRELKEHYKEMFKVSLSELKFSRSQEKLLLDCLIELQTVLEQEDSQELALALIENVKNRNELRKIINYRTQTK